DSFKTVEIRFSSTATQKCYRYLRLEQADGSPPSTGRGYIYSGYYDCNLQVWDATNNVQLDAAFVERGKTDAAGVLQPDTSTVTGFDHTYLPLAGEIREYFFIFNRPYSSTPKDALRVDGDIAAGNDPCLYALTAQLRDPSDVIDDGDLFRYLWANPATPNDVYVFNTSALTRGNAALAKGNLDKIRAVPNPYYNRSRYE